MIITRLQYECFRNLKSGSILPDNGVNVIFGTNAQGKTNLLESIWLLSGRKSFRGSKESELVMFGENSARICVDFLSEERYQNAEIIFRKGKKDVILNGIKQKSASSLIGKLCIVVFSPEHLSLVKNGPAERRKFIDNAICQIKPTYVEAVYNYNRTLAQRNALLKDIPGHPELLDTLDVWDYRLAVLGAGITRMRINYVNRLSSAAAKYHLGISNNTESLQLKYSSCVPAEFCDSGIKIRDALSEEIQKARYGDLKDGNTSVGPHRDDIEIMINKENVRKYGSQGQQRSCVLSMKIAEAELVKIALGQEPVVLLDDVLSELDGKRQEFLLNKIDDRQVFITCCDTESVKRLEKGKLFQVNSGIVSEKN